MKKDFIKPLFFLFLFFFIFLITPAFALTPELSDIDRILTYNCEGVSCTKNQANDNEVCVIACSGSPSTLYRFTPPNATLDKTCNVQSFASGIKGVALVNESHVWINNDAGNSVWYVNIEDCIEITEYLGKMPTKFTSGYVYRIGIDNHFIYYGSGHILDESGNILKSGGGWGVDNGGLSLNIFTSNSTAWVGQLPLDEKSGNTIYRWNLNTETLTGETLNFSRVFNTNAIDFSITRSGGEDYIYWFEHGSSSTKYNLYRHNLSEAVESAGAYFNFELANNSIINSGDTCLNVLVTSDLNGTLLWFINDTNVHNSTVDTSPVVNLPLQYCTEFSNGGYEWRVTFIDSDTISWNSDTIFFTVVEFGLLPTISNYISQFLGFNTLEEGKTVLAFLIILIIASTSALKFGGKHSWQIFISMTLFMLFIFWFLGYIPTIIVIPVLIGIGLMFANTIRNLVGGG